MCPRFEGSGPSSPARKPKSRGALAGYTEPWRIHQARTTSCAIGRLRISILAPIRRTRAGALHACRLRFGLALIVHQLRRTFEQISPASGSSRWVNASQATKAAMQVEYVDVLIVGSGPAGSSSACIWCATIRLGPGAYGRGERHRTDYQPEHQGGKLNLSHIASFRVHRACPRCRLLP
jgi:hypothetical protein